MTEEVTHLAFDVETLGYYDNCVVLTLACVPFKFEEITPFKTLIKNGFFVKFSVEDQIKNHRRITNKEVVDWWREQSVEAKDFALTPFNDDSSLLDGIDALSTFIKSTKYDWKKSYLWSRGTNFDFPKIEHMYKSNNVDLPFSTWKIRDIRTYIDVLTGVNDGAYQPKRGLPKEFVKHHALHDAALDAFRMTEIFQSCTSA